MQDRRLLVTEPEQDRPDGLPFFDEGPLRDLIAKRPHLTGADRSAATATEVSIPPMVGRADVLVVEATGGITIVECKLLKNREGHGAVVGQALSYAAGLSGLSYEEFKARFEGKQVGSLTERFEGRDGWDANVFAEAIARNLEAGRFRVVIAADQLSEPLKVILGYLRDHQPPGIDLDGCEVLVSPEPEPRTREALVDAIRRHYGEAAASPADALLSWAESAGMPPDYNLGAAKVSRAGNALFRIKRYREVRVSAARIERELLLRGSGLAERVGSELEKLGAEMDGKRAKIQLEDLDAPAFVALMEGVVAGMGRESI